MLLLLILACFDANPDQVGGKATGQLAEVLCASGELPAGHIVSADDVFLLRFDAAHVRRDALKRPASAIGHRLRHTVHEGQPLVPAHFRTPDRTAMAPDTRELPVPLLGRTRPTTPSTDLQGKDCTLATDLVVNTDEEYLTLRIPTAAVPGLLEPLFDPETQFVAPGTGGPPCSP